MAIAFTADTTAPFDGTFIKSWTVTALDADTGPTNLAHGFGVEPIVFITNAASVAAAAVGNLSVSGTDATNIPVSKNNAAGSGGAVPGTTVIARIIAINPHSIIK